MPHNRIPTLIKNVKVIDEGSIFHNQVIDIAIDEAGIIQQIDNDLVATNRQQIVEHNTSYFVSPTWLDMRVNYFDPGFEEKEDIVSGSRASKKGGFGNVLLFPNTKPLIHSKSIVSYILSKQKESSVELNICASLIDNDDFNSKPALSDIYDLHHAGVNAFTFPDGFHPTDDFLLRTLEYTSTLDVVIILSPIHPSIGRKGKMHEGEINTSLGMVGIPSMAEYLEVQKIIQLVEYTGAKVHISGISCKEVLVLIQEAKQKGLPITCEVFAHNLFFTDSELMNFDTCFKLNPPLRAESDVQALREGVLLGVIDVVSSNHLPHQKDVKNCEYELAALGTSGTQTVFHQLAVIFKDNDPADWLKALYKNPYQILGMEYPTIEMGAKAQFTIFEIESTSIFDRTVNQSKSINHPLMNKSVRGSVIGVV